MRTPIEIIREYEELRQQLPELIKATGYRDMYIFDKLKMTKSTYYRRMAHPDTWTTEELNKLFEVIKN